jgi:hypothetical protein
MSSTLPARTTAEHDAWRDGYLYGKRDGSEGALPAPRGNAEAYALGFAWGERHQAPQVISPRRTVREGITCGHSFAVTERTIGGVVYQFCRHHSVMSPGRVGIQVWRKPEGRLPFGERPAEVLSAGERIPARGW